MIEREQQKGPSAKIPLIENKDALHLCYEKLSCLTNAPEFFVLDEVVDGAQSRPLVRPRFTDLSAIEKHFQAAALLLTTDLTQAAQRLRAHDISPTLGLATDLVEQSIRLRIAWHRQHPNHKTKNPQSDRVTTRGLLLAGSLGGIIGILWSRTCSTTTSKEKNE